MKLLITLIFLVLAGIVTVAIQAWRKAKRLSAITDAGGIVYFEHEWNESTNSFSGAEPPGPRLVRSIFGPYFFAIPSGIIIGVGHETAERKIEWLEAMAKMPSLKRADILSSNVDDDVVPYLLKLPRLESISLCGTQLSDDGIEMVCSLPSLRKLLIANTLVSASKVEDLRKRFPGLEIVDTVDSP